MCATKDILKSGLCLKVGTGSSIRIYDDLWLDKIITCHSGFPNTTALPVFVNDLIYCQSRTWKADVIENTFESPIAARILQIPLAIEAHDSQLPWSRSRQVTSPSGARTNYYKIPLGITSLMWYNAL